MYNKVGNLSFCWILMFRNYIRKLCERIFVRNSPATLLIFLQWCYRKLDLKFWMMPENWKLFMYEECRIIYCSYLYGCVKGYADTPCQLLGFMLKLFESVLNVVVRRLGLYAQDLHWISMKEEKLFQLILHQFQNHPGSEATADDSALKGQYILSHNPVYKTCLSLVVKRLELQGQDVSLNEFRQKRQNFLPCRRPIFPGYYWRPLFEAAV